VTDGTRQGNEPDGGKGQGGRGGKGQGGKGASADTGKQGGGKQGGGKQGAGKQAGNKQGSGKRAARDRLASERAAQAQADRRKRQTSNIVIVVVVVLVAALIIGYAWYASQDEGPTDAALPALVEEPGGGVVFGDGPVEVDLWEDFQCPGCKSFEQANGELLKQRLADGDITMTVHPLSFLDTNLGNTSSVAAASAFGCAADVGEQEALDFHLTVYANQPAENAGQEAWSTEDLIGWGNDVGIEGDDWETCVTDQTYAGWVEQVATSQGSEGITSTPTVFVDGEEFTIEGDLGAAIDDALAAGE
jgi:protein-disulfide isomerase